MKWYERKRETSQDLFFFWRADVLCCVQVIKFMDTRVVNYDCTCDYFQIGGVGSGGSSSAAGSGGSTYRRACKHIGAVLLVQKKKQDEDYHRHLAEGKTTEAKWKAHKPQMFVCPARQRTDAVSLCCLACEWASPLTGWLCMACAGEGERDAIA
jgi:hypothetical protein